MFVEKGRNAIEFLMGMLNVTNPLYYLLLLNKYKLFDSYGVRVYKEIYFDAAMLTFTNV